MIVIEVDDLATAGKEVHQQKMKELQGMLCFGKWREIFRNQGDFAGKQVRQFEDYSIEIHPEKFIKERMQTFKLSTEQLRDKERLCTAEEHFIFRALRGKHLVGSK